MATQLRIKRGTTNANAPSGLTAGEMAINLVDKKLYVGGTAGTNTIFLDSTAVAGLGTANTFTALQTFSAGISASGGTFTSDIHIVNTTTYTELTVGFGGGGVYSNMAFGREALFSNTIGEGNAAIGYGALANNTEGSGNIALGSNTLVSNTTGSNNIAIGDSVLYWPAESSDNIAIGNAAMQGSFNYNPGLYNIGIGTNALKGFGFTGEANVAIGYDAITNASTGSFNVAIGFESLRNNSTGLYNTSVGSGALRLGGAISPAAVSQMTALGYNAGRYRGTGTTSLVTGTGGIYVGYQARGSTTNQTNEIVIGVDALGLGSNTAVIGATTQSAATIYGVLNLPSGLSAAGATFMGNISAPNIVSSFNGATGTVTGASLGANTFTALNIFSAGISASGATFAGTVNHQDNTLSRVEFLDYFERYSDLGDFTTASTQIPIDLSTAQVFRTKLTVTCTGLTLANVPDNGNANAVGFSLLFVGDGTARTMTWNIGNTAASWAGGTAPTYTSTNNKTDVFSFLSRDGGSTWLGFVGGQNF